MGVGRPFLYAYSAYGVDGVDRAISILKVSENVLVKVLQHHLPPVNDQDELEMNMRLLGAPSIADIRPDMVDASNIHSHVVSVPSDRLYDANCMYYASQYRVPARLTREL